MSGIYSRSSINLLIALFYQVETIVIIIVSIVDSIDTHSIGSNYVTVLLLDPRSGQSLRSW